MNMHDRAAASPRLLTHANRIAERSCSEWQHPLDGHFRDRVDAARARHAARRERKKQSKRGQQHIPNAAAQARGGAVRSLVLEPSLP